MSIFIKIKINNNSINGVNGTGTNSEGVAPGRYSVEWQRRPGRHPVTAKQRKILVWSKEDNKVLFECYIRGEPERRGYRKRLLFLWREHIKQETLQDVSKQRLCDQVRQIKMKKEA